MMKQQYIKILHILYLKCDCCNTTIVYDMNHGDTVSSPASLCELFKEKLLEGTQAISIFFNTDNINNTRELTAEHWKSILRQIQTHY